MRPIAPKRLSQAGLFGTAVAIGLCGGTVRADQVTVAVAANFTAAAKEIATAFQEKTGHEAVLVFGGTGKLFAQIANGAPFDVFLAADDKTPAKAETENLAVAGSRFTYATGRIVLYSTDPNLVDQAGAILKTGKFNKLAIGNPATAPYGRAASEVLHALGVFETLASKIVFGENVAQTYQFVVTGNAELGFVALSQVVDADKGSRWLVPTDLYTPIRQDAVLLEGAFGKPAARAFLQFLRGDAGREIVARFGYGTD